MNTNNILPVIFDFMGKMIEGGITFGLSITYGVWAFVDQYSAIKNSLIDEVRLILLIAVMLIVHQILKQLA